VVPVEIAAVTLTLAVAFAVELAVAFAVITAATAAAGPVYVVLAPLAVCAGLKEPQVPVGVHVQSTPALLESPVTVALIVVVALTANEAGGGVLRATPTWPEAAVMETVATAVALCVLVEVAVMVTVPPAGADAGAV